MLSTPKPKQLFCLAKVETIACFPHTQFADVGPWVLLLYTILFGDSKQAKVKAPKCILLHPTPGDLPGKLILTFPPMVNDMTQGLYFQ